MVAVAEKIILDEKSIGVFSFMELLLVSKTGNEVWDWSGQYKKLLLSLKEMLDMLDSCESEEMFQPSHTGLSPAKHLEEESTSNNINNLKVIKILLC